MRYFIELKITKMLVSIALITRNHEKYISQAIESVLTQNAAFDIEIVVGEDRSDDRTGSILRDYQKKHNNIIILPRDQRIGMAKNFTDTIDHCQGKYIAYLEGDDYWTDAGKLQRQVDFLEKDENQKFCYHLVEIYDQQKGRKVGIMPDEKLRTNLTINDILERNFIGTSSLVFRNHVIKNWPKWIFGLKMMDWPLYVLLLNDGGWAGYIDRNMSVYRIHSRGVHSQNSEITNIYNAIVTLKTYKKYLGQERSGLINFSLFRFNYLLTKEKLKQNDIIGALYLIPEIIWLLIFNIRILKFWTKAYKICISRK